ncbi:hypothetical protein N657DRAFT_640463 [Parathielavia appendiculata]|uniref:Uncharacterized protein n=1 Tax=Parathielavia appendiculata TaxID=2587402 RepID=A0AAN6UBQ3_9PEZI|nr:hypothetical protein N657DRAFT_640463 [Parathielavia appendiculata]
MSRYYREPMTEHMVTHKHDLRDGSMNEPSGGETAEQRKQNTPKKPVEEAFRPSHVLGGEKNAPAPSSGAAADLDGAGEGRTQEGLRRSGNTSEGIGGLEGMESKMSG